jgi:hypothetical protein
MLSEALTSLEDVKTQLQQRLLQQPEYRALLVIDEATSQLERVLEPSGAVHTERFEGTGDFGRKAFTSVQSIHSFVAPDEPTLRGAPQPVVPLRLAPERAAPVPAQKSAAARAAEETLRLVDAPAPTPAIFRMAAVLRELASIGHEATPPADRDTRAAATPFATEPPPLSSHPAFDNAKPLTEEDDDATTTVAESGAETSSPAIEPPVSRMAALYMSIGDGTEDAPPEDREPGAHAGAAFEEFGDGEDAPVTAAPVSGMAAISYETAGDAPDVTIAEDGGTDSPDETPEIEDAPARPASGMALMIAKATEALAPAAKAPAPRSYVPYLAAQRLLQSRRL